MLPTDIPLNALELVHGYILKNAPFSWTFNMLLAPKGPSVIDAMQHYLLFCYLPFFLFFLLSLRSDPDCKMKNHMGNFLGLRDRCLAHGPLTGFLYQILLETLLLAEPKLANVL